MKVNCVMMGLENPSYTSQVRNAIYSHLDLVNKEKCESQGLDQLFEDEPHVTLFYGMDNLGENMCYHILKIKNRDTYYKLKSESALILPEVIINTFDNDDSRVLKIDLSNSNITPLLAQYHESLKEYSNGEGLGQDMYQPHITLTYLKPEVTDEQVRTIIDLLDLEKLKIFLYKKFIMSSESREKSYVDIK